MHFQFSVPHPTQLMEHMPRSIQNRFLFVQDAVPACFLHISSFQHPNWWNMPRFIWNRSLFVQDAVPAGFPCISSFQRPTLTNQQTTDIILWAEALLFEQGISLMGNWWCASPLTSCYMIQIIQASRLISAVNFQSKSQHLGRISLVRPVCNHISKSAKYMYWDI